MPIVVDDAFGMPQYLGTMTDAVWETVCEVNGWRVLRSAWGTRFRYVARKLENGAPANRGWWTKGEAVKFCSK
jgi:hypothetical protein